MGRKKKAQGKGGLVDESCKQKTGVLERIHKTTTTEVLSYPVSCILCKHHLLFVPCRMNNTRPRTWYRTFDHVTVDTVRPHTLCNWILRMPQWLPQMCQPGKNSWCLQNTKCPAHIRFQIDRRTGVLLCTRRTCWWLCWCVATLRNGEYNYFRWRGLRREDLRWNILLRSFCISVDRFRCCLEKRWGNEDGWGNCDEGRKK